MGSDINPIRFPPPRRLARAVDGGDVREVVHRVQRQAHAEGAGVELRDRRAHDLPLLGIEQQPPPAAEPDAAARELIALLEAEPVLREGVPVYVGRLCRSVRSWAALADLSLLPAHGLLAEMQDRLTAKILPSHRPPHDLIEVLDEIGQGRGASLWAERTSDDALIALCRALLPEDEASRQTLVHGSLRAIELLSHRLAATGEEPHLALFAEGGGDHESPFLAQAHEVVRFTAARREQRDDADPAHAFVLLRQCEDETARIERRIPQSGATIRLTYELERMSDLIARLRLLLTTLSPDPEVAWPARITLLRQLLRAREDRERGGELVGVETVCRGLRGHDPPG